MTQVPELFQEIIALDRNKPDRPGMEIVSLPAVRAFRTRRAQLTAAAERYVKRQKSSSR